MMTDFDAVGSSTAAVREVTALRRHNDEMRAALKAVYHDEVGLLTPPTIRLVRKALGIAEPEGKTAADVPSVP